MFCVSKGYGQEVQFSVVFNLFNAVYVIFCNFLKSPETDVKQQGVAARGLAKECFFYFFLAHLD